MTPGEWRDLADSELRSKLEQRGFNEWSIWLLVHERDRDERIAHALDRLFGVGDA